MGEYRGIIHAFSSTHPPSSQTRGGCTTGVCVFFLFLLFILPRDPLCGRFARKAIRLRLKEIETSTERASALEVKRSYDLGNAFELCAFLY